jgi:hypothetical protein
MEKYTGQANETGKDKYGYVPTPAPSVRSDLETKGLVPSPAPGTQTAPPPAQTTKKE